MSNREPDSTALELRSLREGLASGELERRDYDLLRERLARRLALRRPLAERADRRRIGWRWPAAAALAAGLSAALLVPAVRERGAGQTPTGNDFSEQDAVVTGVQRLQAAQQAVTRGDFGKAAESYRLALGFFPDKADLRAEYGFALARTGRRREGIRQLRLAVLRAPRLPSARLYLGAVLTQNGEPEAGRRQWRVFLALEPRGQRARVIRRTLRRLGSSASPRGR